jgi:hypothetical protein
MALQKNITLPNGASGNYIRVGAYTWDRVRREASAHFALFTSAAHATASPTAALCPVIAKVRLFGAKFDEYLGNPALEGAGVTVVGQLYAAIQAPADPSAGHTVIAGGGLTALDLSDATGV